MVYGIHFDEIMNKIDEEKYEDEEILPVLEQFENAGYHFFPAWTMDEPITPDRIRLPSGKFLDENELHNWFDGKKKIAGDKKQIEVLGAQEFYYLVRSLDVDTRFREYNQSFVDDKDIEECRKNYFLGTKNLASKCPTSLK